MEDQSGEDRIDINKILLPKKEAAAPDAAQRVNAAILLEQEQNENVSLPEPQPQEKILTAPEDTDVKPIQTYQSDIEKVIEQKKVSVVSVAAAEAERRAVCDCARGGRSPHTRGRTFGSLLAPERLWVRTAMILGGVFLLTAAAGVLYFVLTRDTSVLVEGQLQAPFIFVDDTQIIEVRRGDSRAAVVQKLETARKSASLALGSVARLYPATPTQDKEAPQLLTATELLGVMASNMPEELARALQPAYLLGVHVFDENQPFLILRVDSYGQGFSGMLAWERVMQNDLEPLFTRRVAAHVKTQQASSTATSTLSEQPIQTQFVDKIVENRDARVIQNGYGDILLLWTFLSRNTILITTNEYTMREVISRLSSAPIVPLAE